MNTHLPSYSTRLKAMHEALCTELTAMVKAVPLKETDCILDAGCGDGFYTERLTDRLGPDGSLIAFDSSTEYLHLARERMQSKQIAPSILFQLGNVEAMPFDAASFDVVWCAHSMQSFVDPRKALCELRRILKPGGTLAIVETDNMHGMILPWPMGLELAVLPAEEKSLQQHSSRDGLYFLRFAERYLSECGFRELRRTTYAIDRPTPFDEAFRRYLTIYLADLYHSAEPYLSEDQRTAAANFLLPSSPQFVAIQDATCVTMIHGLVLAR
ncbi:MAG: class I SAM-dependent methyltransferase [Pirellulales bacterium]